jgi:ATP-dependent Clp protease ATP-binding subunit ClpB
VLKQRVEEARRQHDLQKVADLQYFAIPELEKQIKQMEEQAKTASSNPLLVEVVGPEQVAEVVSRWTGIPVSRLNQTEKDRLLKLSDALHKRVVGTF